MITELLRIQCTTILSWVSRAQQLEIKYITPCYPTEYLKANSGLDVVEENKSTKNDGLTISENTKKGNQFILSPNPAKNSVAIHFSLEATTNLIVSVYDALGRQQLYVNNGIQPKGDGIMVLNISKLRAGSYFLRVITDNNNYSSTLIVQ